ncbi:MAG: hypothetical protein KF691_12315 [Phycisphaeraceae bacterium]|nr:hypothetical protein [Phycisphaeraceae bacterium]
MSNPPSEIQSAESPAGASQDEARVLFLREGRVRCPDCGYDVHGCDQSRCPECAWPLTLQLKPRLSFVPQWMFSLLINGSLFIWGVGGTFSTWMRVWQYHKGTLRKFPSVVNAAPAPGLPRQLALPPAPGSLPVSGGGVNAGGREPSLIENIWTFFIAQNFVYQITIIVFVLSLFVGGVGLLAIPRMKAMSPRTNALLLTASVSVFIATILDYVANYLSVLMRMF